MLVYRNAQNAYFNKQWRPSWDVTEWSISPESALFDNILLGLKYIFLCYLNCDPLTCTMNHFKNNKWVWSEKTTITNRRQPCGTGRKSWSTTTRHHEEKLSKATSSLFPTKMISILERTQCNVQQNIEQLQTPTMGVTINKKSTTTEPPP